MGHKYCIPLIIRPLAYPGRPASSSVAGQMRTFPERTSRLGTPLKFPRCLGIPSPAGLGRELGGGAGGTEEAGQLEKASDARSTQYLLSCHAEGLRENPIWHAGKGFQLYLPPCKYPRVPDWGGGTLFCTEQYKYPIFYSTGALFLRKLFFVFLPRSFILTLYAPPLIKKIHRCLLY